MLFDLRGGGRRRTVQAVYITLAILMGGGLVLFGIGGSVSGGLVDAITQNGGGGGSTGVERYQQRVRQAERRAEAKPKDPAVWAALARSRFQLATAGDSFDANTGQFTAQGKRVLTAAGGAWQKHLALAGNRPDDGVAGVMVQAYTALGDQVKAVQAQEVITEARPTGATFARLAILAYGAGQERKGDLARAKALELTDADQRETLKAQIDEAKSQSGLSAKATPTPTPTVSK
jgi:hypothetical protein